MRLKVFIAIVLRNMLLIISSFLPIKEKLLFISYSGRNFTCNPRSIYGLIMQQKKYDSIIVDKSIKKSNNNTTYVKYKSLSFFYQCLTAKVLITNDGFPIFLPKRKKQILINTWHGGGAYKKVDPKSKMQKAKYTLLYKDTDFFISSNNIFTHVMSKALGIDEKNFLNIGMPRNDIFFNKLQMINAAGKVKKQLNLKDETVILFAPTWRDDGREIIENLTDENILKAFEKRFNNNVRVLIRAHYHTKNIQSKNLLDVSSYPDMQELLCAADILITDYSSCMWDFSLMYKPCFIYATDIDQYKQERDFYTPMSEWPFPIAANNEELVSNIINFDEAKYIEKVKQHHKALGSYEDGHSCEKVCKLIADICKVNDK